MNIEEFDINRGDAVLRARLYIPGRPAEACVVFSHGLFSSKDGYKITLLAKDIVTAGCALLTFDFSWRASPDPAVSGISLSDEIDDLEAAVEAALSRGYGRVHLAGSSMGAAVSLLFYGRGPAAVDKVDSMILIAPPFDLEELIMLNKSGDGAGSPGQAELTAEESGFLKDKFFSEVRELNPALRIGSVDIPVLCIHGEFDSVVPVKNSFRIRDISPSGSRIVVIPGGDHNLTDQKSLEILRHEITSWLRENS